MKFLLAKGASYLLYVHRFIYSWSKLGFISTWTWCILGKFTRRNLFIILPGQKSRFHFKGKTSEVSVIRPFVYGYPAIRDINVNWILDAGANIGDTAFIFSTIYKSAKIIAIEPDVSNYEKLCKNTEMNSNVVPQLSALWGGETELCLTNTSGNHLAGSAGIGYGTHGVSISNIIKKYNIDKFDIVKIDIEGAEKEIFQSADIDWLNDVSIIIIETHDRYTEGATRAIFKATLLLDFQCELMGENLIFYKTGIKPSQLYWWDASMR